MSQLFIVTGHNDDLKREFSPPIHLKRDVCYSLGLVNLFVYNSVPNIEENQNNKLYYSLSIDDEFKVLNIPTGSYEIDHLKKYIQDHIQLPEGNTSNKEAVFDLSPNNNTLKSHLKSKFFIDFTKDDSIGNLLGFSKKILPPNIEHESDLPVNIIKINSIRVECNLVTGSYYDNNPSHTIWNFFLNVDPGYAIHIEPQNRIYLPLLNESSIHTIALKLLDQNSQPINFRGEKITIALELKENGPRVSHQ